MIKSGPPIQTHRLNANGLTFEVDVCGNGDKFAVLLHGFPESKHSWRHQLPFLANLGYTAWAPNLRGYGNTSRPHGVDNYRIEHLSSDVAALIDAAGAQETLLIGHDWGGLISWNFAIRQIRPLSALIEMNCPHPTCFQREIINNFDQKRRSWYGAFFQLPWLPEWALTRNNADAIRRAFVDMAVDKSRFPKEVTDIYVANALRPGGMTAMVNYYRALNLTNGVAKLAPGDAMVRARTLMIWGEADQPLSKETTYGTERYVPDLTIRYIPNVSHWVQQEAPEIVNGLMAAFLAQVPVPESSALGNAIEGNSNAHQL